METGLPVEFWHILASACLVVSAEASRCIHLGSGTLDGRILRVFCPDCLDIGSMHSRPPRLRWSLDRLFSREQLHWFLLYTSFEYSYYSCYTESIYAATQVL
ncbi:hypothetical protein ACQKWADRAFT_297396, partial [Trichoderma austrokoningii]